MNEAIIFDGLLDAIEGGGSAATQMTPSAAQQAL